jgi:hypothetical protein
MAEVITEYSPPITDGRGVWSARACGRQIGGHWEGWIEFIPVKAGDSAIRTPPETTQSDKRALTYLTYWAKGLTPQYLEGALERARTRPAVVPVEGAPPLFETPAPTVERANVAAVAAPHPLLDPYEVWAQGEQRLLDQLAALETDHIRDIAAGYGIVSLNSAFMSTRAELIAHILASARARAREDEPSSTVT